MQDTGFYHCCWLKLKAEHPEYRSEMDAIELASAGLVDKIKTGKEEGQDEPIGERL